MSSKLLYDTIHGYIELDKLCLRIIDTPEFQRLRYIRQLGACHFVFPTATHTRFEHSIGVANLSKEMMESIRHNNPELNISDETIENVQIAGLCHDLGHGPFSHLFDNSLLTGVKSCNVEHEERSCQLLEYLIEKNKIELSKERLEIIQELIHPKNRHQLNIPDYIYQIVCNLFNSIDVDKFDYLKRDAYMLGLSYSFDYTRIIKQARVISNQICFPEKIAPSIYQIFITRWRLHTEIYTHPIVRAIEWMITDCLKIANKTLGLVDSIDDMSKFYKINDNILDIIEFIDSPELMEAKTLLDRIKKRDLYDYIGEIKLKKPLEIGLDKLNISNLDLDNEDIILDMVKIGYQSDPVANVKFYDLKDSKKSFVLDGNTKSNLIPQDFQDNILRIYCRNRRKIEIVKQLYKTLKTHI